MPEANLLRLPKSMQRNLYNDLQIARNTLFVGFFYLCAFCRAFLALIEDEERGEQRSKREHRHH